jgi:hypothetical protein
MTHNYDVLKEVIDSINLSYNHSLTTSTKDHHENIKFIVINRIFGVKCVAMNLLSQKECDKFFEYVKGFDIYKKNPEDHK